MCEALLKDNIDLIEATHLSENLTKEVKKQEYFDYIFAANFMILEKKSKLLFC